MFRLSSDKLAKFKEMLERFVDSNIDSKTIFHIEMLRYIYYLEIKEELFKLEIPFEVLGGYKILKPLYSSSIKTYKKYELLLLDDADSHVLGLIEIIKNRISKINSKIESDIFLSEKDLLKCSNKFKKFEKDLDILSVSYERIKLLAKSNDVKIYNSEISKLIMGAYNNLSGSIKRFVLFCEKDINDYFKEIESDIDSLKNKMLDKDYVFTDSDSNIVIGLYSKRDFISRKIAFSQKFFKENNISDKSDSINHISILVESRISIPLLCCKIIQNLISFLENYNLFSSVRSSDNFVALRNHFIRIKSNINDDSIRNEYTFSLIERYQDKIDEFNRIENISTLDFDLNSKLSKKTGNFIEKFDSTYFSSNEKYSNMNIGGNIVFNCSSLKTIHEFLIKEGIDINAFVKNSQYNNVKNVSEFKALYPKVLHIEIAKVMYKNKELKKKEIANGSKLDTCIKVVSKFDQSNNNFKKLLLDSKKALMISVLNKHDSYESFYEYFKDKLLVIGNEKFINDFFDKKTRDLYDGYKNNLDISNILNRFNLIEFISIDDDSVLFNTLVNYYLFYILSINEIKHSLLFFDDKDGYNDFLDLLSSKNISHRFLDVLQEEKFVIKSIALYKKYDDTDYAYINGNIDYTLGLSRLSSLDFNNFIKHFSGIRDFYVNSISHDYIVQLGHMYNFLGIKNGLINKDEELKKLLVNINKGIKNEK